ncbi:MAG: hypothetical protein QOE03_927 [Micromonosporaceae bacterium]|jgi:hypothetical protein|nr:hypothetical protein [Micromonosporaceae bacterium]
MKAHRTDGLSLAFGLVFLVAVGWWFFGRAVDIALPQLGWFIAGALIVFGALGLFGALRSDAGRRSRANRESTGVEPDAATAGTDAANADADDPNMS